VAKPRAIILRSAALFFIAASSRHRLSRLACEAIRRRLRFLTDRRRRFMFTSLRP
jgi:hypothetical protein